jgi:hypothetical protein
VDHTSIIYPPPFSHEKYGFLTLVLPKTDNIEGAEFLDAEDKV